MISSVQNLRSSKHDRQKRRRTMYHILFTFIMFALGTLDIFTKTRRAHLQYIDNPNYPGGAVAFACASSQDLPTRVEYIAYVLSNWMGDCLVLWRVIVLYYGSRYRVWIAILPFILFLCVILMGIFGIVESAISQLYCPHTIIVRYVILYYGLTLSLSVISAILVISRVYVHKRRLRKAAGPGHGSPYTNIAMMTIESSGLYAVWLFAFLILFILNNPLQEIFLGSLVQVQTIAPLLLVLFISQGKAWSQETNTIVISTAQFASNAACSSPETGIVEPGHFASIGIAV
ncbi:hypothetical protein BV22DRAFT_1007969 [Leucogyrophana mollusca]|uniref:Uncharacterized protein n=1 Tax=Leucogyrophana mollusca TaxID=85980 RepID=A0ACB8BN23_9AGAM|nr:hypothetical protein BV22DRAFT_1007969 [Leucogyrophana mollusca]